MEFVAQTFSCEFEKIGFDFKADEPAIEPRGDNAGCARTAKRIENQLVGFGTGAQDAVEQNFRFLSRVFAEALFPFGRRGQLPHGLHLFVSVVGFHGRVIEEMFGFGSFARPQKRFVGVREVAAGEVRRRVGLVPRDVVEDFETQGLQCETDRIDVVRSARNPDGSVGLEQTTALAQPLRVELVDLRGRDAFIPVAFVNGNHLPVLAGDATARQKIWWVGEYQIERF